MDFTTIRRKKWLKWLVHLATLFTVVWFAYTSVFEAKQQIQKRILEQGGHWELRTGGLILSGAFYLAGTLFMGLFWYRGLWATGQRPRLSETLRAYYIGQLGKYVPGKALVLVLRTGLIRSERVNVGVATASVFLETLTMMTVGAFLAAAMLVIKPRSDMAHYQLLVALAVLLMILSGLPTLPPVFRRLAMAMGAGRFDPTMSEKLAGVTWRLMASGWAMVAGGWVLLGLSLWATLLAMGIPGIEPLGHLNFYIAAVGLSVVAGFVSGLPGGAGIREFVLTAILGVYFTKVIPQSFQFSNREGAALISAVVLRLVWLVSELALAALFYFGALLWRWLASRSEPVAIARDGRPGRDPGSS